MRSKDRATARRQLDKRLNILRDSNAFIRPPHGWIKAIRESLGMTTAQFAKRLGVSQPRAVAIQKAETKGSITLDTLERAAHALDCSLVFTLVPRKPLEDLVEERATLLAKKYLATTRHSMSLEAQNVDKEDEVEQLNHLRKKLLEKAGSKIWEDDA